MEEGVDRLVKVDTCVVRYAYLVPPLQPAEDGRCNGCLEVQRHTSPTTAATALPARVAVLKMAAKAAEAAAAAAIFEV